MAENFNPIPLQTFINDTSAVNAVNQNFAAIASLLNDVLSRSGVTPNQMSSTLDMNSNQIVNLPFPTTLNSPARLADVTNAQNISIVTATTGTSGHVVPFLDGTNTWSNPQTFTMTLTAGTSGLFITESASGTTASPYFANQVNFTDTVNAGANTVSPWQVNHGVGGSSVQGGRSTVDAAVTLTSPSSASNTVKTYIAMQGISTANSGDNGSGLANNTSAGLFFGGFFQGFSNPAATNLYQVAGFGGGISCVAGSTMYAKTLMQLSSNQNDAVNGTGINCMIWLNNNAGATAKWSQAMLIDNQGGVGVFPIAGTGTIIKATNGSVATGIDFTGLTFSGNAIQTPNFSVSNFGVVIAGSAGGGNGTIQLNGITSGNAVILCNNNASLVTVTQPLQIGVNGSVAGQLNIAGVTSGSAQLSASATGGTLQLGAGNVQIDTSGNFSTTATIRGATGVTIPTGGNSTMALYFSSSQFGVFGGTGSPTVSAAKGSIYLENGTGQLWLNTSGSTTWTQVTVP